MQFQSTRDSALRVSSSEAIVRGLAPKSGLFVPESFPKADLEKLEVPAVPGPSRTGTQRLPD